ncbi:MAG: MFS transporter [Candidatus Sulfomarinibacteraceae bacterium]
MNPSGWLQPTDDFDEEQRDRGLRLLTLDGMSTQVMGALTGGALLVAFALMLGASLTVIGLIAAVGPLSQLLQIPAIWIVEKLRRRKALVVVTLALSRTAWFAVAAIPWLVPQQHRVTALLLSLAVTFGFASISSSAFNSWKRDLVPDENMGIFLARRLSLATAAGAVVTLAAGFSIDWGGRHLGDPMTIYSILFLLGGFFGLLGVGFLGRIPEPRMALPDGRGILATLAEPLRDEGFRPLLWFLASWNFAVNMAAPFFTVYMLSRLGLPVGWVLALSVISQVANVSFYPIWGRLADRFSNRSVLGLSGTLFIVCIAMWPFTTMPERYVLTLPLILGIHVLAGISTAGVNLCAGGIALKMAPRGKATAFLATNALISGAAATLAPAIGGVLADLLADEHLTMEMRWTSSESLRMMLTAMDIEGLDFIFVTAVLLGIYALHRLIAVPEKGRVDDGLAVNEVYFEVRRAIRHVGNIAGLRRMTTFPFAILRPWRRGDGGSGKDDAGDAGSGRRGGMTGDPGL